MTSTNRAADFYRKNHPGTPPGELAVAVSARQMIDPLGNQILPISFSAVGSGTQAIAVDTDTVVVLTEERDSHARFAGNKFTPKQLGVYLLIASVDWQAFPSGGAEVRSSISKNGSGYRTLQMVAAPEFSGVAASTSCLVFCDDLDDYFELRAYQDNGADLNIHATNTFLQGVYLGPLT